MVANPLVFEPVEEHLYLARQIAGLIHRRLPAWVEIEDLISDGYLGLLGAALAYRKERGVAFATFAATRIRGAILDGLRERTWGKRRAWKVEGAKRQLPIGDEQWAILEPEDLGAGSSIRDMEARDVAEAILTRLSPRDREILRRVYLRGEKLCSVARRLRLSDSRLTQLRAKALVRARKLGERLTEEVR